MRFNLFQQSDIPEKYRSNFTNLYLDIAWFGVLSGTAVNFLNVYATRLGATGLQIGLLAAMAAIVNLFLAIPAGRWIEKQPTGRAVFWSSVVFRAGYALWIPLPWLFDAQGQIWALIILAFLMAIPLTPLGVGFNVLFAEAVPERFRAHVAGIRNFTFAITYMITSFGAGFILKNLPFEVGYQLIFAIGTFGAAMSSYHIYHVKPLEATMPISASNAPQPAATTQAKSPRGILSALRLDIWRTPFRKILLALFFFHLAQYLPTPVYPLYNVRVLNLNDSNIGTGTALFYLTVLIGSTQIRRISQRLGNKRLTALGAAGVALYPFMLAASHTVLQFYILSFLGGFFFAMVNGSYINYMLENIPPDDRPSHLAWYTIVLNVAILSSSLAGPAVAEMTGLVNALIFFGVMRIVAGLVIFKWG
ncbi:MAG: MFS transporter [Anaerolineales bacterium]|nr:MFS transporter [Anaerolineales bacterium]MBP6210250.1 MFS transporter [Anaerolineales bacterium]